MAGKRGNPISDRVAGNIARLRRERNISGGILAEQCAAFGEGFEPPIESNISLSIISKIETGERAVTITELVLFAGALGVTSDVLMGSASGTLETSNPTLEGRVTALEQRMARILDQ